MSMTIDAHIHLDLYEEKRRSSLLQEAKRDNVAAVVAVSMHLASSKEVRTLSEKDPSFIIPAYGFHPEQPFPSEEESLELLDWMQQRYNAGEAFAIGEVGLPYYSRTEEEAEGALFDEKPYLMLLDRFSAMAAAWDRPIVLHAVYEDAEKAFRILQKHQVQTAHFHWFKGDDNIAEQLAAAGYYISVTPDVEYEPEIQHIVRNYPLELMMVETDGPWRFEGSCKGQETVPAMATKVIQTIAALKGLDTKKAAEIIAANTNRCYAKAKYQAEPKQ